MYDLVLKIIKYYYPFQTVICFLYLELLEKLLSCHTRMTRFFHRSKHDYDQTAPTEVVLSGYILFTILAS